MVEDAKRSGPCRQLVAPVTKRLGRAATLVCARSFRWWKFRWSLFAVVVADPTRSRDLAAVCAREAASLFFAPTPERPYTRPRPEIYGGPDDLHTDLAEQVDAGPVSPPTGGIALLAKASVLAGGVVLTSSGRVVAESLVNTHDWREFWPFAWRGEPSRRRLRIKMMLDHLQKDCGPAPHILIKQTFDDNYGHWLVECLPRIVLVGRHFDLTSCKIIIPAWNRGMRQIYRDSLAAFGIADHQLVEVAYSKAVHVDKLIYPLPIAKHPWAKSPRGHPNPGDDPRPPRNECLGAKTSLRIAQQICEASSDQRVRRAGRVPTT